MPLLFLVLQGYIFAFLLLKRFFSKKHLPDLFLSLLLFITGYHTTTYIIGFMDWYDTYQNTKINYFLIDFLLAIGPLVYFYIKSITQPYFKFRKIDFLHFVPALVFFIYKICIYLYDAQQPNFDEVQNGWFLSNVHWQYVSFWLSPLKDISYLGYSLYATWLYFKYRKNIIHFFSNTYNVELNWLRTFLFLFIGLFLFHIIIGITDYSFFENHWKQRWWGHLLGALIMLYIGMMGYFSDFSKLYNLKTQISEVLELNQTEPSSIIKSKSKDDLDFDNLKEQISSYMETHQPFLNPEITLPELAKDLKINSNQLSQVINNGFGKNFNEFINFYRVEMVKTKLQDESLQHLSLLGIALECGFNSKATFNRVFKKLTNQSPSAYQKNL